MDPLDELFALHDWATRRLLEHCASLPASALSASAPGTYGSLLATLVHLVSADQRYLELLTGEVVEPRLREGMEPAIPVLEDHFVRQAERWRRVLEKVDLVDVTLPSRGSWPEMPHARNLLIVQALTHGGDHRTHACTILGALGLPVPDLDGWAFWRANHL
ncbi:MAG TPA: DinB family protein [Thermomicrobiaceae bacterium]|nr:DinB family protein [Thermomicrobiaceae bacterium]